MRSGARAQMRVRLAEVLVGGRRRRRSLGGWVGLVLAWWGEGEGSCTGRCQIARRWTLWAVQDERNSG